MFDDVFSNDFSCCGYGDAITVRNIDDEAIKNIELYMATELMHILSERHSVDESINSVDFYGKTFASKPSTFRFKHGEVHQIKEIVAFVKHSMGAVRPFLFNPENLVEICDLHGMVYFNNFGRYFTDPEMTKAQHMLRDIEADLKFDLFNKIKRLFDEFGVNTGQNHRFHQNSVKIIKRNNSWSATVVCCLCKPDTKKSQFIIQSKSVNGDVYWITSNFSKHLRRMHKDFLQTNTDPINVAAIPNENESVGNLQAVIYNQLIESLETITKGTKRTISTSKMYFQSENNENPWRQVHYKWYKPNVMAIVCSAHWPYNCLVIVIGKRN